MDKKGFTLIEIILATSVLVGLLLVVSAIAVSFLEKPGRQISSMDIIDLARMASSAFVNEIRNASSGNDGSFCIAKAGNSEIIFYSTLGSLESQVNRIRYFVSDGVLYKGVTEPAGNPPSYNPSSEKISTAISKISNGSTPVFYYYDGDYNGKTGALLQPVNINQIRFVEINIMEENFSVNAGVAIRSLKDNSGN